MTSLFERFGSIISILGTWLWRFCAGSMNDCKRSIKMISRFKIRLDSRILPGYDVATRRPDSYVEGEKNVDGENDILRRTNRSEKWKQDLEEQAQLLDPLHDSSTCAWPLVESSQHHSLNMP